MKSDTEIKRDVENELKWDPDVDASDIGIAVKDAVVTLTGFVRSFSQKWDAERAVKRVAGVAGIANSIEVRLPLINERPDPEIARDAVNALRSELPYSAQFITVTVKSGWATLEGNVEWNYQRERAESAVRRVRGLRGVSNLISLKPAVKPEEVKHQIEEAFKRSAAVDAKNVMVEADGGEVTLRGTVRSWAERQEAERTAWRAPGVTKVDNRIIVSP